MAQYRNVKEFLDKINDKYKVHRAEYERLNEQFSRNAEQWKKEVARGWSNYNEQQEARFRHEAEQREIKNALDELRTTANTDFENILAEADDVFGRYNRATGDKLDLATVELLKSGILRPDEIKALINDFDGNSAMLRIIGDYAYKKGKEEKDKELFAIGTQFKDYRIPYNEHLDTLIMWSQKAMRDDRGLSDGIARVYDEQADKIFADAEGVYITVSE